MADSPTHDPIAELITNYNELNSSVIEEFHEEPSALEFMRFVARNTPFVVRGGAADWQATREWTVDYLRDFLGDQLVNVAVTPAGNADAPTLYHPPTTTATPPFLVLAKPHEHPLPFTTLLAHLTSPRHPPPPEVHYAQTQNDNLRHEYAPLFTHRGHSIPPTIPWARLALARAPDAVNLWVGNARSITALHKDGYENVYVQVSGRKHFVLLPPVCHPCVNEQMLPGARYVRRRRREGGGGGEEEEEEGGLELVLDEEEEDGEGGGAVPFPIWDPDKPEENATKYSALARPMRVTLEPGDMLYLPCLWYHKVSQSCPPDGVCIAINYWYDMEYTGPLYPLSTFVRSVSNRNK